ncbi:MAG TPA: transcriptional regulator PpsR [Rhodopila sp.]|nr:transcriptional regulator PpsR [Rhodopila sp.]
MPPGINIAQPDVTLMLDADGVIQDVTLSNTVSAEAVQTWRGRPWVETFEGSLSGKVQRMLAEARENGVSAFRQLNQRFPSGLEVPMEYTTIRLGGSAGMMAIGRNLQAVAELQSRLIAAQQAMEQEYWKLREVETRYRLLFDASNDAVVTLRADNLRIIEANPVAIRLLGLARGRDLLPEITADDRDSFQAMLRRVRQSGRAPGLLVHFGPQRAGWLVRASLMPAEPGPMFLIQLAQAEPTQLASGMATPAGIDEFFDRLPDGFVVIDREGFIRRANQAFLDLVQMGGEGAVLGQSLGRWLSRPGADLGVLLANLHRHGSVRLFATTVQGELGGEAAVEISAAGNTLARPGQIALLVRDVGRRLSATDNAPNLQAALSAIIEQSGNAPLRTLVRDTVALVERHYIIAALSLTDGNRTAAAEMLGLSRQGFYKKLAQYEIDGHSRTDDYSEE